jgi:hypothetical protein
MSKNLFPYVKLRQRAGGEIRPRFEPSPRERALGFAAEDLKHDDGRWFTLDEVARFASARLAEIKAARLSGERPSQEARSGATGKTVSSLLDAYLASPDVARLAALTQRDYLNKADAIRFRPRVMPRTADMPGASRRLRERAYRDAVPPLLPEPIALAPARAVKPTNVKQFFEYLVRERGLAMARGTIAVLSAAYKWGRLAEGWELEANPCRDLDLPSPKPDLQIYTPHEISAAVAMGDLTGDESVVDAIVLGLLSDQRPTDILAFTGAHIIDGFVRLVQSKTGTLVELPALTALTNRLVLMAERRRARGWQCPELIVDERTGQGFVDRAFNDRWRALIAKVAAGDAALGLAPVPSIAGKKFKHLRKTTFTWLHNAGNDLPAIGSVSGHALSSLPQIAKHYLALDRATAAVAMGKLDAWMTDKGVKL